MVFFHHRAVVEFQSCGGRQRRAHDFPSVLVDEDDLGFKGCCLEIELSRTAHIYVLEPVVLFLILLARADVVISPANPRRCICKCLIGMPARW